MKKIKVKVLLNEVFPKYSQTHSLSSTCRFSPIPFHPVTSHSYSTASNLSSGSSEPWNLIPKGQVYTTLDLCSKVYDVGSKVDVKVVGVATAKGIVITHWFFVVVTGKGVEISPKYREGCLINDSHLHPPAFDMRYI